MAQPNKLDVAAVILSLLALVLSYLSFAREPERQSDQLTSEVIRSAYSDFIAMTDLRTQFAYQSHLFEVPDNYQSVKSLVRMATLDLRRKRAEVVRLELEERAVTDRLFTMFEQAFYQWGQARDRQDTPRAKFLGEVLSYFTGRLLKNPRLLWYWAPKGGNLAVNYEPATVQYYEANVKPAKLQWDATGPFR
jgi:hypothetical protein